MSNLPSGKSPAGPSKRRDDEPARSDQTIHKKRVHFRENELNKVDLRRSLLTPMWLDMHDTFLRFNKGMQIQEHMTDKRKNKLNFLASVGATTLEDHMLSVLVLDGDTSRTNIMIPGCVLSGARDMRPMRRNVFKLEPVERSEGLDEDQVVRYEQDVHIAVKDTDSKTHLYFNCKEIQKDVLDMTTPNFPVKLYDTVDQDSVFQLLPWRSEDQDTFRMLKIAPNSTVAIRHKATMNFMTIMFSHYESEMLGSLEKVITCSENDLSSACLWTLRTGDET